MELIDKVNMSLDDIIKHSKEFRHNRGGGRRRGPQRGGSRSHARGGPGPMRNRRRGGGRYSGNAWKDWDYDTLDEAPFRRNSSSFPAGATTIVVSNLDFAVTSEDVLELFSKFGPIESAVVKYDASGRSLGYAEITFEHRVDAIIAREKYNGVPLDDRPMDIEIKRTAHGKEAGGRRSDEEKGTGIDFRRGKGGFRSQGRDQKSTVTAEELDAELDEYLTNRQPQPTKWSSSDSDSD